MDKRENAELEVEAIIERAIEDAGYELAMIAGIDNPEARDIITRIFTDLIQQK